MTLLMRIGDIRMVANTFFGVIYHDFHKGGKLLTALFNSHF
ncbi:hypothetical protein [Colwellia ponticola]|nr:hypothetical protein [Colwellia ponticola]